MSRLVVSLPTIGKVFDENTFKDLVRQLEQAFQKLRIDATIGQTDVSGNYTVGATDSLLLVDTTASNVTVQLPLVARWMIDEKLTVEVVKIAAANRLQIIPAGSDTINDEPDALVYVKDTALALRAVTGGWRVV